MAVPGLQQLGAESQYSQGGSGDGILRNLLGMAITAMATPSPQGSVPPALIGDAKSAIATGDPQAIRAVIPSASGTGIESTLSNAADFAQAQIAPIQGIQSKVNSSGGIAAPEGRLAAADGFRSLASMQKPPNYLKAVGMMLSNDPNWKMEAGKGVTRDVIQYGKDGQAVQARMNANSDIPEEAYDSKGNPLNYQQYMATGAYKERVLTPAHAGDVISADRAASDFASATKVINESAPITQTLANNARQIYGTLETLKKNYPQIPADEWANAQAIITSSEAKSQSISSGLQNLNQINDNTTANDAVSRANALAGSFGIPGFNVTKEGKIIDSNGKSVSNGELKSRMNTASQNYSSEKGFTSSREALLASKVYGLLKDNPEAQAALFGALTAQQQNEKLIADNQDILGKNPLLGRSIPYAAGNPMSVGQANMLVYLRNEEINKIAQDKVLEAHRMGGTPDPGAIFGATANDPKVIAANSRYGFLINALQGLQTPSQKPAIETPKTTETKPKVKPVAVKPDWGGNEPVGMPTDQFTKTNTAAGFAVPRVNKVTAQELIDQARGK